MTALTADQRTERIMIARNSNMRSFRRLLMESRRTPRLMISLAFLIMALFTGAGMFMMWNTAEKKMVVEVKKNDNRKEKDYSDPFLQEDVIGTEGYETEKLVRVLLYLPEHKTEEGYVLRARILELIEDCAQYGREVCYQELYLLFRYWLRDQIIVACNFMFRRDELGSNLANVIRRKAAWPSDKLGLVLVEAAIFKRCKTEHGESAIFLPDDEIQLLKNNKEIGCMKREKFLQWLNYCKDKEEYRSLHSCQWRIYNSCLRHILLLEEDELESKIISTTFIAPKSKSQAYSQTTKLEDFLKNWSDDLLNRFSSLEMTVEDKVEDKRREEDNGEL